MSSHFFKHLLTGACAVLYCHFGFGQELIPQRSVLTTSLRGVRVTEKAVQSIVAYGDIRSGSAEYIAGKSITMEAGFHVAEGATFMARIEEVKQPIVESESPIGVDTPEDKTKLFVNAYPNPYSEDTQIAYWLPNKTVVSIIVFDAKGTEVSRIIDGKIQSEGMYKVTFKSGRLPSGTYLCTVNTSTERKAQTLIKN